MTKLDWASIYAGVNILLLFLLAFGVVRARQKHKVSIGDGGNPAVLQAMRAHGNATEYIPVAVVGLGLMAILDPVPVLWVQALGGVFTLGRILHAIGLSGSSGVSFGRMAGMVLTWTGFVGIGGVLVWAGVSPQL